MARVVCALSGGVDSSVAAGLLKRKGFAVVGVFMKFWAPPEELGGATNRCCSSKAEVRARKTAAILKIPFYVFDFSQEFKERVVADFLAGLKKGITPNPCVVCNYQIKFGLLWEKILGLGADWVATGHYAQIRKFVNSRQIRYSLISARDKNKDQSYFLWMLRQEQLSRTLFPLADYTRKEVEDLAKKWKLPAAGTKKSVEICFVGKSLEDFLKKYLGEKPGNIVDTQGRVLGKHRGLWFYTIGQRRGIGFGGGPYFVKEKNFKTNTLVVTKEEKDLYQKELICRRVNWIRGEEPKLPLKIRAKIRYHYSPSAAEVTKIGEGKYKVIFAKPQRAITPGQSVVFYRGEEVLGGGIIEEA